LQEETKIRERIGNKKREGEREKKLIS
jgi:hypothetical protein